MAPLLRPLTLGELLDRAFQLYRSRFALFVGIAALAYLPLFLVQTATLWIPKILSAPAIMAASIGFLISLVLQMLAVAAASSATIIVVSAAYLERPITLREAYGRVSGMLLRVFFIMIGSGIGIAIGLVLLIVPGIILFLMWALAIPVAVLEDAGLGESLSRSRELTREHRGRVFLIYLLYFVLVFALQMGLMLPVAAAIAIITKSNPAGLAAGASAGTALLNVGSAVVSYAIEILVTPILTISLSLMYYDERVRKEAFDIQLMMSAIDGATAPPAAAGAL
ncbi:MAG TPA: glycerophosphoryl diester phosphodiesterase membrane domain-containing protein [Candidatus Binatia bacterium]|nr:glycerophosphoryl diester phosphodiesterase membrane domain-containing protein [Candidatus Binatia bacterium]